MATLTCMSCGDQWEGPEPLMCCSGYMCGCMGMPIDPVVCSKKCYYNLPHMKNQKQQAKEKRINEFGAILNKLKGSEFDIAIAKAARDIYWNAFRPDDYDSRHRIKRKFLNWRYRLNKIRKQNG